LNNTTVYIGSFTVMPISAGSQAGYTWLHSLEELS
jgi:hypothetical protein